MKFEDLDGQMRRFERSLDRHIPKDKFIIARLDGRGFTKLTNETLEFDRPFDQRFHDAMIKTCQHLMDVGFRIAFCYTQSDEISLLFDQAEDSFNRKERKLVSILAGEASSVFSLEISHPSAFDCRLCPLPTLDDVIDYFRWRFEDAKRNALSAHCYWQLRKQGLPPREADRQLSGLSMAEKHALLLRLGINLAAEMSWKRQGTLLVWETIPHAGRNPITGQDVATTRQRIQQVSEIGTGDELAGRVEKVMQIENV